MRAEQYLKNLNEQIQKRRKRKNEKLKRDIESGLVNGKVHENGVVSTYGTKGIQNWYTTRELKERVTAQFDRMEAAGLGRICRINSMHTLQIRGKHLRRLLKAMPNVRQEGRYLIETMPA